MATKRTPLNRGPRHRITPEAVEAFRAMQAADTDEEWTEAHGRLHDALGLPPWEWYAIEDPAWRCPYPAGSWAAIKWHADRKARPHAFALFAALVEAAGDGE